MIVNSHKRMVLSELNAACERGLERWASRAEAHAKEYCPVDTGTLRDSIRHEPIDTRTTAVGSSTEYAAFVELGHHQQPGRYVPAIKKRLVRSFVPGQPYLRPALENHLEEYRSILTSAINGNED